MLAISVFEALKEAIAAARGDGAVVQLNAPATAENVLRALCRAENAADAGGAGLSPL
jgi:xanthine dehydrogenase large subunit